ncbi:MAG: terminase small subunit [Gammaproteobacteria bacterium]|nr:terminase small subunit [Gammaproteobacteria bacterium]NVK89107.1 terminase small subunit [Gammaproteobacteria bacterium]
MKSSNYLRQAKRRNHRHHESKQNTWQDKVVGKYQLTLILDINRAQLDRWIKEGLPVVAQGSLGKDWEFDLVAVKSWIAAHQEKA